MAESAFSDEPELLQEEIKTETAACEALPEEAKAAENITWELDETGL